MDQFRQREYSQDDVLMSGLSFIFGIFAEVVMPLHDHVDHGTVSRVFKNFARQNEKTQFMTSDEGVKTRNKL